jgi:peptide deformylase|tara:strand:- start:403 stop:963 length:561 start_codon:yes stop_codon:yes gene_type:complete
MIKREDIRLLPPTDPRVITAIAPFQDDMLKEYGFKDRQDLTDFMFETMVKYGGIGLSCNQVGLPFNMFVLGGHPQVENGLKMSCFNPMILSTGDEDIMMKEGCLTYPFIFLAIKRPRKCVAKYEDEKGDLKEASLDGLISRVYQHEQEHMLGRTFTEHASKLKLDIAQKKAKKQIDMMRKYNKQPK